MKNAYDTTIQRLSDEDTLPFNVYLKKYYSPEIYASWSHWKVWNDFIDAAFDEVRHFQYRSKSGYYRLDRDFHAYPDRLNTIKGLEKMPMDIRKVIVFLEVDGFFDEYRISVPEWLTIKNFCNPKHEVKPTDRSVTEILTIEYGENYIRECLINLRWWDFSRGPVSF